MFMGLHRFKPMPSGRMGIFWTLSGIREAAVAEFGCMGHNIYSGAALRRAGIYEGSGASLYTTYIDETDIAMGDTSRLNATISRIIETEHPKVIFLQPSAVPEVIGTDLTAVSRLIQPDFPQARIIPVGHGSFAISQHRGVQEALLALAEYLPKDTERSQEPSYNIIGSCPDMYRFHSDTEEVVRLVSGAFGMSANCILSSDTSVSDIENLGAAHVNLVIRREGIPAAQALKKRFGTPYVTGRPYGIKGTAKWLSDIAEVCGREPDRRFCEHEERLALAQTDYAFDYLERNAWSYPEEAVISAGGHADVVRGIVDFAVNEMPLRKGICWCDCPEMADDEIPYFSEKEWIPAVRDHKSGYLMFSGEALHWAGKNTQLQISNPDIGWRLHSYDPPFMGYRGAVSLVNLWINEYVLTH